MEVLSGHWQEHFLWCLCWQKSRHDCLVGRITYTCGRLVKVCFQESGTVTTMSTSECVHVWWPAAPLLGMDPAEPVYTFAKTWLRKNTSEKGEAVNRPGRMTVLAGTVRVIPRLLLSQGSPAQWQTLVTFTQSTKAATLSVLLQIRSGHP